MESDATRKSGSAMSDRQMARAAVDGRMVTFIQTISTSYDESDRSISGFLVGMDDYHWMIVPESSLAIPHPSEGDVDPNVFLVHKSCPFVMISPTQLLSDRHTRVRERVARVGQSFWDHCLRAGLVRTTATTPQEQK